MNGIIVVYKEKDWTSFDVVAKLRGIFHEKKIGHGGTLDPMATGVLPVFVGKSARACDILPDATKAYVAGFRLGEATDTLDVTGKILSRCEEIPKFRRDEVCGAFERFVGDIMQIPPMYSAVKIGGKKLYTLAREGKVVERAPRAVTVYEIKLTEFDENTAEGVIYVRCKKGTYIRSLIDDAGSFLGCGAVMTSLERVSSAGFDKQQAKKVSEIEEIYKSGGISQILTDVSKAFDGVYKKKCMLDERLTALYKNGVKLTAGQNGMKLSGEGDVLLVYSDKKEFLGLAELCDGMLKQVKNFY